MRMGLVRARKVAGKWHCSKMCPLSGVMKSLKRRTREWRKWQFGQYLSND